MQMIYGRSDVEKLANTLLALRDKCKIFTFTGSLGAGKTTLIRTMLNDVGVQEPITSPTFTYVNQYTNAQGENFYHFDLYRIATLDAFVSAGFDELLYAPNSWCFIEWPQVIMPLLTHDVCHVTLEYNGTDERLATWHVTKSSK